MSCCGIHAQFLSWYFLYKLSNEGIHYYYLFFFKLGGLLIIFISHTRLCYSLQLVGIILLCSFYILYVITLLTLLDLTEDLIESSKNNIIPLCMSKWM